MKIFVSNQFYDKFEASPEEMVERGFIYVGFDEGGRFHSGFAQSRKHYRDTHKTEARIIVDINATDCFKYVKFTCVSDFGSFMNFCIFIEHDEKEVMELVSRFKKSILENNL